MEESFKKNLIVFFSMTEQENMMSALDIFAASQETFEEAKKKSSDESRKRANYLRFSQDGTYAVRILPLAPVIDKDGKVLPMERKGYEYPLRSLMLKIENDKKLVKGKPSITYVTVCDARQRFSQLKEDLIDLYVSTACDMYADDEDLCKKLRSNSFEGGLKWDSKRCMYVIDCDHKEDGLQILQLSFAQYKELEERKLNLWAKLNKKKLVNCPISSIDNGYPLEIIRKTENKKTSYSFNIDTVSGAEPLDEQTLQTLLDARRLPEILYNYTRFHLEATIAYLTQLDKKYDIDVMSSEEIKNCIEQIKTLLPSEDTSHFSMDDKNSNNSEANSSMNDLDALWERFDKLDEAGLDDESAEGQELRTSIKEFIEDNDLDIQIKRSKSNQDLLDECEKMLGSNSSDEDDEEKDDEEEEEKPAPKKSSRKDPEPEPEEEEEDDSDNDSGEEGDNNEEEEEAPRPRSSRRERNDDTNEPAARSVRRGARPNRRR